MIVPLEGVGWVVDMDGVGWVVDVDGVGWVVVVVGDSLMVGEGVGGAVGDFVVKWPQMTP